MITSFSCIFQLFILLAYHMWNKIPNSKPGFIITVLLGFTVSNSSFSFLHFPLSPHHYFQFYQPIYFNYELPTPTPSPPSFKTEFFCVVWRLSWNSLLDEASL